MKVVVADTSPINYLVLIDCIDLLPRLYRRIVIPAEVLDELSAAGVPHHVATWIGNRPDWVEVRQASADRGIHHQVENCGLDAGEKAAIELALAEPDALLLIDEAAGRSVATRLGIANTGTVGVLVAGAREGLVDLDTALDRLQKTNFRISQSLIARLLSK